MNNHFIKYEHHEENHDNYLNYDNERSSFFWADMIKKKLEEFDITHNITI